MTRLTLSELEKSRPDLNPTEVLQLFRSKRTHKSKIYTYIIATTKHNYYKIGVSKNPALRLKDLQTACPIPLYLLHVVPLFNEGNAYRVETLAHEKFKANNTIGEWFEFTNLEVLKVVSFLNKHSSKKYKNKLPIPRCLTVKTWRELLIMYS